MDPILPDNCAGASGSVTSQGTQTAWIEKLPFEILENIALELLSSPNDKISTTGPFEPSPILPLLRLAVFRPVARPIFYRSLSLGKKKIAFSSKKVRRGSEGLFAQRALWTLERNFKVADAEQDAAALVKCLDLVSWYEVGVDCRGSDIIVDGTTKDIACHKQIIRRCSALTHISLHYIVVPQNRQHALVRRWTSR